MLPFFVYILQLHCKRVIASYTPIRRLAGTVILSPLSGGATIYAARTAGLCMLIQTTSPRSRVASVQCGMKDDFWNDCCVICGSGFAEDFGWYADMHGDKKVCGWIFLRDGIRRVLDINIRRRAFAIAQCRYMLREYSFREGSYRKSGSNTKG